MKTLVLSLFSLISLSVFSQAELSAWLQNTNGDLGYNNQPSNIQSVDYTNTDVYVSCTCIPGYDVGPWAGNPNDAANQNFCFKITRTPQESNNPINTGLGHIGVWVNGVSIFNAKDAFSYNNQNVWFQDALVFEGSSFDECLGHPAQNGEYHHHINPTCLYDDMDDQNHSPIIGYAFDGFPIYGAYAYENTDGTGAIKRMTTSYQLREITERTSLPDGTQLNFNQYGPAIDAVYPLGSFVEDYEFVENSGDLNAFNGRFCITPEYPNGIFAYFVTIDEEGDAVYPYVLGPSYYGVVQSGNTGPQSGHHTIPSNASEYNLALDTYSTQEIKLYPNPVKNTAYFESDKLGTIRIYSLLGKLVDEINHSTKQSVIATEAFQNGVYIVKFQSETTSLTTIFVKE